MNIAIKDKDFKKFLDSLRKIKTNGVRRLESFETMLKRVLRYEKETTI